MPYTTPQNLTLIENLVTQFFGKLLTNLKLIGNISLQQRLNFLGNIWEFQFRDKSLNLKAPCSSVTNSTELRWDQTARPIYTKEVKPFLVSVVQVTALACERFLHSRNTSWSFQFGILSSSYVQQLQITYWRIEGHCPDFQIWALVC